MIDTTAKNYAYCASEGYMQWNSHGELVNVTAEIQEANIAKYRAAEERYRCKDCKLIWSSLKGW